MSVRTFAIVDLSCVRRSPEKTYITSELINNGFRLVEEYKTAETVFVFTCAFCKNKIDRSLNTIREVQDSKKPDATVIVGGCLGKIDPDALRSVFSGIFIDPVSFAQFNQFFNLARPLVAGFHDNVPNLINVCRGCNRNCSYCAIRNAVGRLISRPINIIRQTVEKSIHSGITEIHIAADCLSDYGIDIGVGFEDLLQVLIDIEGKCSFALYDIRPEAVVDHVNQFKQLGQMGRIRLLKVAIQSASPKVLDLMNRPYDIEGLREALTLLRRIPDRPTLQTTVMVGFPGESEEDFEKTDRLLEQVAFDRLMINIFDPMPGTAAAAMGDTVDAEIALRRKRQLLSKFPGIAQ